MPPRLVIFDMDDVLCHYDLGRRLRALSQISGKTPRVAWQGAGPI